MRRYWFEFEITDNDLRQYATYSGLGWGCGVTAVDYDDALRVLTESIFHADPMPKIRHYVEDVDISTLDKSHVLPNMGVPTWRGVWFPRL